MPRKTVLELIEEGPVKLGFDPNEIKDKFLKKIFHDRITRTLWIAFKMGHITSQHFIYDIIIMGNAFNKEFHKGAGQDMDIGKVYFNAMFYCQGPMFSSMGHWVENRDLIESIKEYLFGEKKLEFIYDKGEL